MKVRDLKRISRVSILTLGGMLLLCVAPVLAQQPQPPQPPPQPSQPCAKLQLTANPTTANPGQMVTINASLQNCTSAAEQVQVNLQLNGPVGLTDAGTVSVNLDPNQTMQYSVGIKIPTMTPPGGYTVTGKVLSGSTTLAQTSVTVNIT